MSTKSNDEPKKKMRTGVFLWFPVITFITTGGLAGSVAGTGGASGNFDFSSAVAWSKILSR